MWGVRPPALRQRAVFSAPWGRGRHCRSCLRRWQGEQVCAPLGVGRLGPLPHTACAPGPPLPVLVWKRGVTPAGTAHPHRSARRSTRRLSLWSSRALPPGSHGASAARGPHGRAHSRPTPGRQRGQPGLVLAMTACGPGRAGCGGVRLSEARPGPKSGVWTSGLLWPSVWWDKDAPSILGWPEASLPHSSPQAPPAEPEEPWRPPWPALSTHMICVGPGLGAQEAAGPSCGHVLCRFGVKV